MSNFFKKSIICLLTLFILGSCSNGNKLGQSDNVSTPPKQQGTEKSPTNDSDKDTLNKDNTSDSSTHKSDNVSTAPEQQGTEKSLGDTQPNINEQSTIKHLDKVSNKTKTKPTKKWNMQRRTVKKKKDEN